MLSLTIYHQCECEVLEKSILLDPSKDGVDSCVLFCNIPNNQGKPVYMVTGAPLGCNHPILQPKQQIQLLRFFPNMLFLFTLICKHHITSI